MKAIFKQISKQREDKYVRLLREINKSYDLQHENIEKARALEINALASDYFRTRLAVGGVN